MSYPGYKMACVYKLNCVSIKVKQVYLKSKACQNEEICIVVCIKWLNNFSSKGNYCFLYRYLFIQYLYIVVACYLPYLTLLFLIKPRIF